MSSRFSVWLKRIHIIGCAIGVVLQVHTLAVTMNAALETPPKKPRIGKVIAGGIGSDEETGQHDAEEDVDAEDEGGGLTPPKRGRAEIKGVPIQEHTNVMVVSGGMTALRKNDEPCQHVLQVKTILGGSECGRRVMWPIRCTSQEACRVLTGSPACYRPLSWKNDLFFKNYRDAVEAAAARDLADRKRDHQLKQMKQLTTTMAKHFAPKLLKIIIGGHEMVVENTTRRCSIEATCSNIDFVIQQLKSAV